MYNENLCGDGHFEHLNERDLMEKEDPENEIENGDVEVGVNSVVIDRNHYSLFSSFFFLLGSL